MKGKRLYQLINELSRTEHRQLVNACKLSADKRATALGELLRKRNLTEKGFEKWLLVLVQSWNIPQKNEREKKQRRWVDFACKEIEQLLLKNHFAESDDRHYQLANLFDKRNHEELTTYYNEQALKAASSTNNLNFLLHGYDIKLRWLGRNQTKGNIAQIGSLLIKRKEATERSFHEAMSYFYNVSSALYIDNPNAEAYKQILPEEQKLIALGKSANDEYSRILYLLAQARFSFYQQSLFKQHLLETFSAIQKSKLEEADKQRLGRSSLYLRITGGLYYGFDLKIMIKDAEAILVIMLGHKIYDPIGLFFLLFFLLIDKKIDRYDSLLKKHKNTFFTNENEDYPLFLDSLRIYLKEGSEKALINLQKTCYSKSLYVAAWSKLLEIEIHAAQNDKRFAQVLIARAKRFIKTNSGHRLIAEPVLQVLNAYDPKKGEDTQKPDHKLFAYYKIFLKD